MGSLYRGVNVRVLSAFADWSPIDILLTPLHLIQAFPNILLSEQFRCLDSLTFLGACFP